MKDETLNTLLTDRALGELSPEVSELLDAYVSQDPHLDRRAQERQSVVATLRSAISVPTPKVAAWRPPHPPRVWPAPTEWARLAAVLVLGVATGWVFAVVRHAQEASIGSTASRSVAVVSPAPADAAVFWRSPLKDRRSNAYDAAREYRLRWESPGKMPTVEENR